MTDYIDIGPTPYDEECTPAGKNPRREREEMAALRNQIRRILGKEPEGARFAIKSFNYGGYIDLVCEYDDQNDDARAYAFACERACPARWDIFAIVELTAGRAPIPGDGAWRNSYTD